MNSAKAESESISVKGRSARLIVRLASEDLARFRFLLEAYDNLAIFSVLERRPALIKVIAAPESLQDLKTVLEHIGQTIRMHVEPWPFSEGESPGFDNTAINR